MIEPHSYPDLLNRYPELRLVKDPNVAKACCRIFPALHMGSWVGRPSDRQQLAQLLGYGDPDRKVHSPVIEKVDAALEGVIPPDQRAEAVRTVGRIFSGLPATPIEDGDWADPMGGFNSYVQKHERCDSVHKRVMHGVVTYVNVMGGTRMYPGPFYAGWWGEPVSVELKREDFPYHVPSIPDTRFYTTNLYETEIDSTAAQQWLADERDALYRTKFTYGMSILATVAQECMAAARTAIGVPADYSAESTLLLSQLACALWYADGDGILTVTRVLMHLDVTDEQRLQVTPILEQFLPK